MISETIFAVASGAGKAGVAMLRLSGPATRRALESIATPLPAPRRASLRLLRAADGAVLDQALVLWFPAPASFTGEDCGELHLHGGRAVVAIVLQHLDAMAGLRPAEPGEFTRRAFLNGRIDLAQAEGLADLIDSETEWQRRQAVAQFERGLSIKVEAWRRALLGALALVEAEIDFVDEEDVPPSTLAAVRALVAPVIAELQTALAHGKAAEVIRDGYTVLIAGPPNAGKSSLLNKIARRDVAIVSEFAGTTRDIIEVRIDLGGLPIVLVDSAGMRETSDPVEREGVARARARARDADMVLWLAEVGQAFATPPLPSEGQRLLRIATKIDRDGVVPPGADHGISVASGEGVDGLLALLRQGAESGLPPAGTAVLTRSRHRQACAMAETALGGAMADKPVELVAEDLRVAVRALGSIIGSVDVEEVLGEIFSRFCVGK